MRRRLLQAGAGILAANAPLGAAPGAGLAVASIRGCGDWPAWQAFVQRFLQADGRILDPASARAHTVSEGQAYALFFALVAGERARFERILRWTEDNLAGGDLSLRLPAWQWGRRDDGGWGVLDDNPAADADLWLAYALGEAGRLWKDRRYVALSSLVAERIVREETALLPGLGRTLLPGVHGFATGSGRWRLNPSYAPLFLLRWFAARSADARWADVLGTAQRMLLESAPHGLAPDWTWYRAHSGAEQGYFELAELPPADRVGGYDAIRIYLWLGLTAAEDPARTGLLRHFAPMAALTERSGVPPETVDAGSAGFAAAVLPFLVALGRTAAAQALQVRLQSEPAAADAYYAQALSLFGLGWCEQRYAFAADGSLLPAWRGCAPQGQG
jgi:endoglucanase